MTKKLILIFMVYWITVGYLIEYEINNIEYRLWYDLENDNVEMWLPIKQDLKIPDLVKKHWINQEEKGNWDYVRAFGH